MDAAPITADSPVTPSRRSHAAPCSTVPFNEANLDRLEKVTLLDGVKVECGEGRSVEVWRVKEEDGYCIRIFRPTNDGKISKLMFGLKPPAANALMIALSRHLSNDKLRHSAPTENSDSKENV